MNKDCKDPYETMMTELRRRAAPYMSEMINAVIQCKIQMDRIHERPGKKMECDDARTMSRHQKDKLNALIKTFEETNFITLEMQATNLVDFLLWSHQQFAQSLRQYASKHNNDLVDELERYVEQTCVLKQSVARSIWPSASAPMPSMPSLVSLAPFLSMSHVPKFTSSRIRRTQIEDELKRLIKYRDKVDDYIDELMAELAEKAD